MKKTLYDQFDKSRIASLPCVHFDGRIEVVVSASEAARAVRFLLQQDILGVDTETRPTFRRGDYHHVALLQVSTRDICFLFRLNHTGITPDILRLLEDTTVPKIGLSLCDDMNSLHKLADFTPGSFIDLQNHMKELGVRDLSLQKLYANFFNQKISKRQQLSNWERDVLEESQKRYAAIDAWACVRLYEEFKRMTESGDYELVIVPEEITKKDEETIS